MPPITRLLSRCFAYIRLLDLLGLPKHSQLRYINTWSPNTIGFHVVSLLSFKISAVFPLLYRVFISTFSYLSNSYSCLAHTSYLSTSNFSRIVISWGKFYSPELISYIDPYSNLSSQDSSTLFVLFCEDISLLTSLPSNVIVISKSKLFKQDLLDHQLLYLSKAKFKHLRKSFRYFLFLKLFQRS